MVTYLLADNMLVKLFSGDSALLIHLKTSRSWSDGTRQDVSIVSQDSSYCLLIEQNISDHV